MGKRDICPICIWPIIIKQLSQAFKLKISCCPSQLNFLIHHVPSNSLEVTNILRFSISMSIAVYFNCCIGSGEASGSQVNHTEFNSFSVNIYAFSMFERKSPRPRLSKQLLLFTAPPQSNPCYHWRKPNYVTICDVISSWNQVNSNKGDGSSLPFISCNLRSCLVFLLLCQRVKESSHNLLSILLYNRLKINYQYHCELMLLFDQI